MKFFNLVWVFFLIGTFSLASLNAHAQSLSGTKTVCTSGCDYPTISAAVSSLNTNGVGGGGVNFNIAAGHVESLVSGIVVTVTGTSLNPIVFQKSGIGANPKLIAFTGSKLASSLDSIDVMMSFEGSDYVTIDGVDFQENVANTNPSMMMETAIGFYKKSGIDGANNNLIRNCSITLSRDNVIASAGVRSNVSGSVGIEFVNARRTALGTNIEVTSSSGASSFNKIYGNTIQSSNFGISLVGFGAPSPYLLADMNNEIGGEVGSSGNTIINFGGGVGANTACGAIFINNQWGFVVSNNIINNNTGLGVNHPNSNRGIWIFASSAGSSCIIKKNKITISGGLGTSFSNWCLDFEGAASGANGNSVNIDSNQFVNCNVTSASTLSFSAIWLSTKATNVNVRNNYVYGFRFSGTGTSRVIFNELACENLNISNNVIDSVILDGLSANGTHYNISVNSPQNTLNIKDNLIRRTRLTTSGSGGKFLGAVHFWGNSLISNCVGNTIDSISRNGLSGGSTFGIYQVGGNDSFSVISIKQNIISNIFITGTGLTSDITGIQTSIGKITVDSNVISNLSCQKSSGQQDVIGISNFSSPQNKDRYIQNKIYNLSNIGTGAVYGLFFSSQSRLSNEISYNQVYALSGAGLTVTGVVTQGSFQSVFNNKIFDISSTSSGNAKVSGLSILSTSGTAYIYNNLISDLRATLAFTSAPSTSPSVVGINIPSSSGGSIEVSHNTVFINATSTNSVFGTASLFHADNFAPVSQLTLRNNILINTSTSAGAGKTVAYHRSGTTMGNFNLSSCNNLYYAGVPSAANVIFYDGLNADQSLGSYQARVMPRDSVAFIENVSFISTLGTNAGFLKVNPLIPTSVEATAALDVNIGFDFINRVRAGFSGYAGTSGTPDLGAWEENLTPISANNMYFDSLNAEQTSILSPRGSENNIVIRIPVYTRKGANALVATSFKLRTTGTTNTNDILDARIYYTGKKSSFDENSLFGSFNNPSGAFTISGNQALATGTNYFWLTYSIKDSATLNNFLDAILDSITLSGNQYAPVNGNPSGVLTVQSRLKGDYRIGVNQTFATLTQALIALKQLGVSSSVRFILKDTVYNTLTGESFPLVFQSYTNASTTNTVVIMPDSGINVKIDGNSSVTTIDFNNCSHFYIDGRQMGTAVSARGGNLIIKNTSTTAPAVRFINDADSNQIQFSTLLASNTSFMQTSTAGVVNFGTTNRTLGNDFNTVRLCRISSNDTSSSSFVGISSIGGNSTVDGSNDNNVIDSCDIFDVFSANSTCAGIYVGLNNNSWKINNNRIYQTTPVTKSSGYHYFGIVVNSSSSTNLITGGGFVIHNNIIGGSNLFGTGYFDINGISTQLFYGISLALGSGVTSSIQGNLITNIKFNSQSLVGIDVTRGNVNIGTIEGNVIGSKVNNGSIKGVVNSFVTNWIGIRTNGNQSDSINIANNVVSGFEIHGPLNNMGPSFTGIHIVSGNKVHVWNNLIGDTLPQNSNIKITSVGGTTSAGTQRVCGIYMSPSTGTPTYNIHHNTISNLFNYNSVQASVETSTSGIALKGTASGVFKINDNKVTNLYSASLSPAGGTNCSAGGIVVNITGSCEVKNNLIRGLHLTANTTGRVVSIGISINMGTNNSSKLSLVGNFIHTQMVWGNNSMYEITGIELAANNSVVSNNMIRLGLDTLGNTIQPGIKICGIFETGGSSNVFNNSVYIGGSNVSNTTNNTHVFRRYQSSTTEMDSLRNNIFVNNRINNSPGGPGHYALNFDDNSRIKSDNNLFWADTIGRIGNTVLKSLNNWRFVTYNDTNSIYGNPGFINPNGGINTLSLMINSTNSTPIEGTGALVNGEGADIDFDGQLRALNTPVDIGADAGIFSFLDLAPPIINHTVLSNTTGLTDRVISATITDKSGIYTSGLLSPRIYFKKFSSGIFQSTQGVLISGNAQNGSWIFTINNALLGGVAGDDSIYYFIVAQDSISSSNLGSAPLGVLGNNVVSITSAPILNSYKITAILSGTFNVGVGQSFTSLTGIDGFFNYLNTSIVGGNIIVNITSDIEEPGIIELLNTSEIGAGNYTILIQPNAPVLYSIFGSVGSVGSGLIRLAGAKRVTIDGRYSGAGRYLRFINRQLAGATLLFYEEARRDTIRNCIVEGVNNTSGIIQFGGSSIANGFGNDSNAIIACLIRDTAGTQSTHNLANTSIYCSGTVGRENDRITITDNEIVNFGLNAVNIASSGTGNFWNISNNKIYQTITKNYLMQVILIQGGSGHIISNNSIGGAAMNRGGAALRSSAGIIAIDITSGVGTTFPIIVSSNTISNLAATGTLVGVSGVRMAGGNVNIVRNIIGGGVMPFDTIMNCFNGAINIIGGVSALIDSNTISHIYYYRASLDRTAGINIATTTTSPLNVRRNIIQNISGNNTATGTSSFRPSGVTVTSAPTAGLTITQNTIRNIFNFNQGTDAYLASGIFYSGGSTTNPVITQNRIRNIGALGVGVGSLAPEVSGICIVSASNAIVANNQISLGDSALSQSRVYAILDGSIGNNLYAYNSIFITGFNSSGGNHSAGLLRSSTAKINFRNNLIFNKRASLGTGFTYAVSSASSSNFSASDISYNMFFVRDTARLLELPSGTSVGWSAMNNLYSASYNTNWAERTSFISPHTIFVDTLNGNLSIDTSSPAAWYVNGKGIRIPSISGDFNNASGVRSTAITTGATDIGSVEFSPTSLPPLAYTDKLPSANDSTRFYFASKIIAKAVWSNSGTLPALVNLRYYSGVNPANTPVSSTFSNAYYDIQTIGGSGYNYNLSLMNDSAILGSLTSINRAQIANYQNSSSNWIRYTNTTVSGNNGFLNAPIMTNIGVFTFTDSAVNPLLVSFSYFKAKVLGDDVILNWQTFSEKNNKGFYLERSTDGLVFNEFDFVLGKSNSSVLTNYISTDRSPFSRSRFLYYRLKQVDFDGNYQFSRVAMVHLDKTVKDITIYPNPVLTSMFVEINSSTRTNLSIQLIDVQGKELFSQFIKVEEGLNRILIPETIGLKTGIYFAKIIVDENVYQMKLVKE
jgi:hypothetical protein